MSILDWGGGRGRLGMCMQLIEKSAPNKFKYKYEIYEPHVIDFERDRKFVTYRQLSDIKKKYNCVVLMNVLHEIGTKLWISLFRQIKDCLRSDGVLIFAEAKVLSIGEQPYCENGYIVLGEKQIRILFKKNEYDSQIAAFHADFGKKEKSEFIIIPADELSNISETNIKNALENLEEETFVTLNNMNEERVRCIRESKKPSFTYRKYAFVAQQYINAKIVIEKYYSPIALNMQITEAWKENI